MTTTSIWRDTVRGPEWHALDEDVSVDVAIVGGGITGVSLAYRLAEAGREVVLLEAGDIGAGDSGGSTGNLYATISSGLHKLRQTWGDTAIRQVAQSRAEAVDWIEQQVLALGIQCSFRRCPLVRYAASGDANAQLIAEWEASQAAGLMVSRESQVPDGIPPARGEVLVLDHQAQFHPLAYLQSLAQHAAALGARIHTHSPVRALDIEQRVLHTPGGKLTAKEIVLATHSPSGIHLLQAAMVPHREYGVAVLLDGGSFPAGIFYGEGSERLSLRGLDTAQGRFVICVGQSQKSGQHDARAALHGLEELVHRRLGLHDVRYRWSAQNFPSPDGLPYIGRSGSGVFIATGFATDGLTYGSLAAQLIADELLGRKNPWAALYAANRFTPLKSARSAWAEASSMTKALVQDYVTQREREPLQFLAQGAAAIADLNGERVAAYRDHQGRLFAVSPVCSHMKCQVRWNAVETSWDCPCHGSRFAPDGRVLSGPAVAALEPKLLPASDHTTKTA